MPTDLAAGFAGDEVGDKAFADDDSVLQHFRGHPQKLFAQVEIETFNAGKVGGDKEIAVDAVDGHQADYLVESGQTTRDSEALRTFVWKGRMAYTTPMVMVTKRCFQKRSVEPLSGWIQGHHEF